MRIIRELMRIIGEMRIEIIIGMMTAMSIEVVKISATCISCDWITTIAIVTIVAVMGNGIHGVR